MSKVLVVEDDESTQELIRYILESKGLIVDVANDGGVAIKKVRTSPPDVIVLDIMLPSMDGYQVCKIIKHNAIYKSIPIIMLSAKTGREDINKGMELGADDYMTKPFDNKKLVEKVLSFAASKPEQKAQKERCIKKEM
jgi:two-component system, OmpR family, alkaline phosphatase synthesis response regulator PhoP